MGRGWAEDRVRDFRSWPQCMRKNERRLSSICHLPFAICDLPFPEFMAHLLFHLLLHFVLVRSWMPARDFIGAGLPPVRLPCTPGTAPWYASKTLVNIGQVRRYGLNPRSSRATHTNASGSSLNSQLLHGTPARLSTPEVRLAPSLQLTATNGN